MKTNLLFRNSTLLTTLLLAFGLVTCGQAQTSTASTVTTLDEAYATLAQAKHDYKGHRAKAMEQIKLAIHELGGSISGKAKAHESQAASDAQLKAAQALLQQTT